MFHLVVAHAEQRCLSDMLVHPQALTDLLPLCVQTAVEVFRRMILEVEKMEAGQPQGRTPCSMM